MAQLLAAKHETKRLFGQHSGVEGVGIGDGCVRIYVRAAAVGRALPDMVAGVRIECIEVGTISVQSSEDRPPRPSVR